MTQCGQSYRPLLFHRHLMIKREYTRRQNGKSVYGATVPINLLQSLLFCAASWLAAQCTLYALN